VASALGKRRAALLAEHVHGHHDRDTPVGTRGDPMYLDPPLLPGRSHVIEVLAHSGVTLVRLPADGEDGEELDFRIANRNRGVDVASIDRVGQAANGLLVLRSHAGSISARSCLRAWDDFPALQGIWIVPSSDPDGVTQDDGNGAPRGSRAARPGTIGVVPDCLYFTESDEANELIATDPMALLIGFALDQQVTVQKAFMGPLVLKQRLGSIDAQTLAAADLEPVFREKPALHRYPGNMAKRVHELAVFLRDEYDGDAARIWTDATDADDLRARVAALPGFGEMKVKALGAVLAKRFGVAAAEGLVPPHPTLGDVDSRAALDDYKAAKREHKGEWLKVKA
jgi:uncharacterized HhH-GPD family protein